MRLPASPPAEFDDSREVSLFEQAFAEPRRLHLAELTLSLPLPPSLWEQYEFIPYIKYDPETKQPIRSHRKVASRKLLDFRREAAQLLMYAYRLVPLSLPWQGAMEVKIEMLIMLPNWRSDGENRCKAAIDVVAPYLGFNDRRVIDQRYLTLVGRGSALVMRLYLLSPKKGYVNDDDTH